MQGKEPTACLVNTLSDKVSRIDLTIIELLQVLERIVDLGIRHSAGIEPYIDQVCLTLHRLAGSGNQDNIIHIRTVQIDLLVVLLRIISRSEVLIRVRLHKAGLHRFLDLAEQLYHGTDTLLLATIFRTPDR